MSTENDATKKQPVGSATAEKEPAAAGDKPPLWQRRNFRVGMLCVGVFVIGAAIGSGATAHAIFSRVRGAFRDPEVMATRMLGHMESDLELTEDQKAKIKVLLTDGMTKIGTSVRTEFINVHAQVRELLAEEQRKTFDEHVERMHRHGFHPPGHGCMHGCGPGCKHER